MSAKETNPKDAVGVRKAPFSTIPGAVLAELGCALLEGARKYGRHNWRESGVRASVYYDAALRHLLDYWEGTDSDGESGLPHITKAIASLTVLRDAQIQNRCVDDRPPASPQFWLQVANAAAAHLVDLYPEAPPPFTQEQGKADS